MKNKHEPKNPYATNRGGRINAPVSPSANDPKSTVTRGDDLRRRGGKR